MIQGQWNSWWKIKSVNLYLCVFFELTCVLLFGWHLRSSLFTHSETPKTPKISVECYINLSMVDNLQNKKKKQFKSVPCQPRFIVHLAQQTIQGWIKRSKCVHIGGQILIAPSFCSACSLLKIHVHIKMITIMKYQTTTGSSWITNVTASWCTASHRSMCMKLEMKLLISVLVCSLACVSTDNTYHSCQVKDKRLCKFLVTIILSYLWVAAIIHVFQKLRTAHHVNHWIVPSYFDH